MIFLHFLNIQSINCGLWISPACHKRSNLCLGHRTQHIRLRIDLDGVVNKNWLVDSRVSRHTEAAVFKKVIA